MIKDIDYRKGDVLLLEKQREDIHDEILYQLKLVRGIDLDEIDKINDDVMKLYIKMIYPD